MMRRNCFVLMMLAAAFALAPGGRAGAQEKSEADLATIAKGLHSSLVRVEYTLRYDKGQAPGGSGIVESSPASAQYRYDRSEDAVKEERPLETGGYLIAPDKVLTCDMLLHPRFVEKTQVVLDGETIGARAVAYARNRNALILQLDHPFRQGKVLKFDAGKDGSYYVVNYALHNGQWMTSVSPLPTGSAVFSDVEARFTPVSERGVIVAEDGTPVAMNMTGELALDGAWKGSPEKWSWISDSQYQALLDKAKAVSDRGVLRVRLDLRSPRVTERDPYSQYDYGQSEDDDATEIDALALLMDSRRVLVLSSLKPPTTARLEAITIYPPGSEEGVPAKFTATLRDYGAFVAMLDEPLDGALKASDRDVRLYEHQLLAAADISLQGENRIAYFSYNRLSDYVVGWRRHVFPNVPIDDRTLFMFDDSGTLVALPIMKRERLGPEDRWSESYPNLTWAGQVAEAVSDLDANADKSNVPLSEEEENRTAWLGVTMQSLDAELARQLGVSELSHDGTVGGLVTYVYPDSPAAQAGIVNGDVLLRIHSADLPTPLDVAADEQDQFGGAFPWARLDELPEEYFEVIPTPWPKVDNAFNKKLTAIGFGTPIQLEYVHDGKAKMADMTITQSPVHYDAAPQYKCEALGLTVRPLTYELRRYFQKEEGDPGVIVAHIQAGSKASVVGVKPFEIITAVNDQPVSTTDEFRKAVAGQTELRLSILRMTRTRQVKITLDAPIEDDAADGGDAAPADEADGG